VGTDGRLALGPQQQREAHRRPAEAPADEKGRPDACAGNRTLTTIPGREGNGLLARAGCFRRDRAIIWSVHAFTAGL